jgi:TPR repeat protein
MRRGITARVTVSTIRLAIVVFVFALPATESIATERHYDVAIDFYLDLARTGLADAQLVLGDMYKEGDGVSKNLVEAFAWYYLAAQQGLEEAIKPMNEVMRSLPEEQWAKARALAEEYEQKYLSIRK